MTISFNSSILQLIVYLFELFITQLLKKKIRIENEIQYKAVIVHIKNLLKFVIDDTHIRDKNLAELKLLSNLVSDFDEVYYPI